MSRVLYVGGINWMYSSLSEKKYKSCHWCGAVPFQKVHFCT